MLFQIETYVIQFLNMEFQYDFKLYTSKYLKVTLGNLQQCQNELNEADVKNA